MKPYFLVVYNFLKFGIRKLFRNSNFKYKPIQMLSYSTKISMEKGANVTIGNHIVSDGRTVMIVGDGAVLAIGDHVYFNEGVMLSCKEHISIGAGTRFGPNVKVFDNDHIYDAMNGVSAKHTSDAISIGQNCWLAANVVVLRGTQIGDNCVIGAGCVVRGVIPSGSLVTQNRTLSIRPIGDRKK